MTALVVRADSRRLPLPDSSVDLVCTSPPYFGLRSYTDGGVHYAGQVGDEATPAEFVAALLEVTAECMRVLKPSGSIWVNLGDKYAPGKTLIGLPWRYALACIDDLGLILRAEVIWSKPNGLPESVTDRVRRSHEQWFHMTKEPRYFSAVDEVREPVAPAGLARRAYAYSVNDAQRASKNPVLNGEGMRPANDLGKLPGSVWTIPTHPLQVPAHLGVDHFAAFPMEWPRRIIKGWSPSGICVVCGEGRQPVTTAAPVVVTPGREALAARQRRSSAVGGGPTGTSLGVPAGERQRVITGEACACTNAAGDGMACGYGFADPTHSSHEYGDGRYCPGAYGGPPPTRPAVVLDPFGGTGTTALVASALGRTGVSVDLSHDYSRLARWRTSDPGQRASAMQVDKPPVEVAGQADLFGDVA